MKKTITSVLKTILFTFWACSLTILESKAQTCTGSTPVNPGAQTGNLYTSATINPGNTSTTHWFKGSVTGATITMSGTSKLIIKTGSSLSLSGAYTIPNGCQIYVESGASFTTGGALSFGNTASTLINLGTVNITGYLNLGGGKLYNDGILNTSTYLWLTQTSFTFLNGGSASFSYVYYQLGSQATSSICLRPGSIFNIISNAGYTITGTSVSLPTGGLFQYNATDISNNASCSPGNPARINYYDGYAVPLPFLWGAYGTVCNHANITIVGSIPSSSGTGTSVLVTSGGGYVASSPQNFVLNTQSPVPNITGDYFKYCLNATVPLNTMASGSNLLWYTSASGGIGSSSAPSVNTSSAGLQTFWVNQNVTSSCEGPRNPINIEIVNTTANTVTASNNGPVCVGSSLSLTGSGTGISSWNWTGPNNYTSTSQNPTVSGSVTMAMFGTYTLITTQTSGTCLNSTSTNVSVCNSLPVTITANGPTTFCSPGSVILTALTQTQATSQVPPSGGTTPKDCNCPDGYVVVGIEGRTGSWIDQFTLRCRKIDASGNLTGPIVLTNPNGTSTGGSPQGPYDLPSNNVMVGGSVNYYNAGADVLLSIGLRGQSTSYVLAGNNNNTGASSATVLSGGQSSSGSLGTVYVPNGNVITGMKAFDNYGYAGGVQWIYTPLTQLTSTYSWSPGGATTPSITASTSATYTVTVTGAYFYGSASQVVSVQTSGTWLGVTSSAWATTSNWGCGIIPTLTTDISIPSSAPNMPVIAGSAICRNLTIAPSASLTNNGTLSLYGNFTGNAATSYVDKGTTAFVGSATQTISGIDTLHDITINNTAGVILSSPAYVKQYLTLTNGTLTSNGNLTVDIYFGAIKGTGNGAIAGNINVVRTIWNDRWHYISSPLATKTFADINDDVLIKFGANANLYEYDETVVDPDKEIGWTKINSTATSFQSMKGYALFFPLWKYKTEIDFTGTYDHNASYSDATLSNTPSSDPTADGWNLVGNPYPSEIDWDAPSGWTKTGLDNAVYIYDSANNRYATYIGGISANGGSRYIPVMQAFYVRVTNPGTGTLAMNKNVRSTVQNKDNFRLANEFDDPIIRLKSSIDTYSDETVIRINDKATDGFDSQLDAFKMPSDGNTPSISTRAQNKDYVVNSLPTKQYKNIIPVRIIAANNGKHTITADITGFYPGEKVVLEDKLLGVTQDLIDNPYYEAELVKGDTTTRFFINYSRTAKEEQTTATNNASENNQLDIFAYKQNVNVLFNQNTGNADIFVYDLTGNKIANMEKVNTNAGKVEMNIPNAKTGIYIVKVMANNIVTTKQVYISK